MQLHNSLPPEVLALIIESLFYETVDYMSAPQLSWFLQQVSLNRHTRQAGLSMCCRHGFVEVRVTTHGLPWPGAATNAGSGMIEQRAGWRSNIRYISAMNRRHVTHTLFLEMRKCRDVRQIAQALAEAGLFEAEWPAVRTLVVGDPGHSNTSWHGSMEKVISELGSDLLRVVPNARYLRISDSGTMYDELVLGALLQENRRTSGLALCMRDITSSGMSHFPATLTSLYINSGSIISLVDLPHICAETLIALTLKPIQSGNLWSRFTSKPRKLVEFKELRMLSLGFAASTTASPVGYGNSALPVFPRLTSLKVSGYEYDVNDLLSQFPRAQIESLELRGTQTKHMIETEPFRSLKSVVVFGGIQETQDAFFCRCFKDLTTVQQLTVDCLPTFDTFVRFPGFVQLRSLELTRYQLSSFLTECDSPQDLFKDGYRAILPHLKQLSISGGIPNSNEGRCASQLVALMAGMPQLECVRLGGAFVFCISEIYRNIRSVLSDDVLGLKAQHLCMVYIFLRYE